MEKEGARLEDALEVLVRAEDLRALLEKHGITWTKLAEQAEMPISTIWQAANTDRDPQVSNMRRVTRAMVELIATGQPTLVVQEVANDS